MSFFAFVERMANLTAIPLALLGFGITLWQIKKTQKAVEAARNAAESTQAQIGRGNLLALIPQLQRAEDELERAVRSNSSELTISWLSNWRWQAGQVRGLLLANSPSDRKILKAIQNSVSTAALVKSELLGSSSVDLVDLTRPARDAIAMVTNEIGEMAARHGMNTGDSR